MLTAARGALRGPAQAWELFLFFRALSPSSGVQPQPPHRDPSHGLTPPNVLRAGPKVPQGEPQLAYQGHMPLSKSADSKVRSE